MEKGSKKVVISVIIITVLVIGIIAFAYKIFMDGENKKVDIVNNSGTVMLTYANNDGIFIIDPLEKKSDDAGQKLTGEGKYFDFVVTTEVNDKNIIEYELAVNLVQNETNIDPDKIKIYLEKENSGSYGKVIEPTIYKKNASVSSYGTPMSYMSLYHTDNNTDNNENYRLRVWIDQAANIDTSVKYKAAIQIKVYAKAKKD